eukprot:12532972-Heterocapsa_arctica.AAC.1
MILTWCTPNPGVHRVARPPLPSCWRRPVHPGTPWSPARPFGSSYGYRGSRRLTARRLPPPAA